MTAARVGLFLHFHPRASTSERSLNRLRKLLPRRSLHAEAGCDDEVLLGAWSIRVSRKLLHRMEADASRR